MVLVIIAVMAMIAVPRYSNSLVRYRADAAARRIAADFELARAEARQTSQARTVAFDVAANELSIPTIEALDDDSPNYVLNLAQDPYGATLVSANFNGGATVEFDGYGMPDNGGTVVVEVGSEQRQIILNAETGRVSVQ